MTDELQGQAAIDEARRILESGGDIDFFHDVPEVVNGDPVALTANQAREADRLTGVLAEMASREAEEKRLEKMDREADEWYRLRGYQRG
jgi:hypothetical protein